MYLDAYIKHVVNHASQGALFSVSKKRLLHLENAVVNDSGVMEIQWRHVHPMISKRKENDNDMTILFGDLIPAFAT